MLCGVQSIRHLCQNPTSFLHAQLPPQRGQCYCLLDKDCVHSSMIFYSMSPFNHKHTISQFTISCTCYLYPKILLSSVITHNVQISKFKFLCLKKYRALHTQKMLPFPCCLSSHSSNSSRILSTAPQNSLIISRGFIITFICCPQILSLRRCTLPPNADVPTFPKAQLKTQGQRRVSGKKGGAQIWFSPLTVTTPFE